jgi:S-adenosylmethionine:tRNA ribosyltransferase-isomerase
MKTSDFNYELPQELIAQEPPKVRGSEKMMVLFRDTGKIEHRTIADIGEYLGSDDLLIINDTKVFPARLQGSWSDTRGAVELLLLEPEPCDEGPGLQLQSAFEVCRWKCIYGSGRRVRPGQIAVFGGGELKAEICQILGEGVCSAIFASDEPLMMVLDRIGKTPVPPYIRLKED